MNILRGEMSVVGPRPALDYELPYYKDWYYRRFAVRPGLTGLWQVKRATAEDFDEMIRMDVEYVELSFCSLARPPDDPRHIPKMSFASGRSVTESP